MFAYHFQQGHVKYFILQFISIYIHFHLMHVQKENTNFQNNRTNNKSGPPLKTSEK